MTLVAEEEGAALEDRIEVLRDIISREYLLECNGKQTVVPLEVAREVHRLQEKERLAKEGFN